VLTSAPGGGGGGAFAFAPQCATAIIDMFGIVHILETKKFDFIILFPFIPPTSWIILAKPRILK
jgi:hypothetical protein